MRYVDPNTGDVFAGRTAARVVLKMKADTWMAGEGKVSYMHGVADRCKQLKPDALIRAESPESFLASLVDAGFLVRER